MANVNLSIFKGDDKTWTITFKDVDGDAIDLTGKTLFFTIKTIKTDPDTSALIRKDINSHTNPTGGITALTLSHDETDLTAGIYYFDFQLVDSSSNVTTLFTGTFTVTQDVTRRTS